MENPCNFHHDFRLFFEQTKTAMNVRFHKALENPTMLMILDRLYIYSVPKTTEVNEFGKPIYDKWTVHRVIAELRGITLFLSTDERVFMLSLVSLFIFYFTMLLVNYLQVGDENDYMNV